MSSQNVVVLMRGGNGLLVSIEPEGAAVMDIHNDHESGSRRFPGDRCTKASKVLREIWKTLVVISHLIAVPIVSVEIVFFVYGPPAQSIERLLAPPLERPMVVASAIVTRHS